MLAVAALSAIGLVGSHGSSAPVTASTAPTPVRGSPSKWSHWPATTTRDPSGASTIALTSALAFGLTALTIALVDGFHDSKAPAEENAARCRCVTLLAVVNEPPT